MTRRRRLLPPRTGASDAARRARRPRFLARTGLRAGRFHGDRPARRS